MRRWLSAGITYALIEAPEKAGKGAVFVAGLLGIAAAVAFVLVERRRTRSPEQGLADAAT